MKKKPSKQIATNPETITAEDDRVEFDILPVHPIYEPCDNIQLTILRLLPVLEAAIGQASRVQENSSSHDVENYAKYRRLHTLLCELVNGMKQ